MNPDLPEWIPADETDGRHKTTAQTVPVGRVEASGVLDRSNGPG